MSYSYTDFDIEESRKRKGLMVDKNGNVNAEMIGNSNGGSMNYPKGHSCYNEKENLFSRLKMWFNIFEN